MAKRLTDVAVAKAKRPGITWDANTTGLALKILPSGKKVWIMQLRWPGCRFQTMRNLGYYPSLSLAEAREKAEKFYAKNKEGTDPFAAEAEAKEEERRRKQAEARAEALKDARTFAGFADRYIAERSANRRAKDDAREIRRNLIAAWGDRPIHKIAPRDVRELIDKIKQRAPYDAANTWGHAVGIFKAAVHEELIEASPCASLDKKMLFKGAKIGPRQRVLTDEEVFAFWRASGRLGYPAGPAYRLLMLTACRVSEIAEARWSELHPELRRVIRDAAKDERRVDWSGVDDKIKLIIIPRERFKSDAEHAVPLCDAACAIIERLPRFAGCDFIFTTTGTIPISGFSKAKARLDARMLRTLRALARMRGDDPRSVTLPPWVNHDLRRVVRTNLSALGIADHVCELCLGHGRKGLQRVYDQHRYHDEIRAAMVRWSRRLREIVLPAPPQPTAPNVVKLRA